MSSLFGGNTNAGLFGQSTATSQPAASGGLFGNSNTQNQNPSGGLFGSSTNQNQNQASGLFGSATTQAQQTSSLFANNPNPFGGATTNTQNQTGSGLLGANTTNTQNQQSGGLFANTNTTNQPRQSGGLFANAANTQTQPSNTGGLFGAANNTTTTQNQPAAGSSLFGNNPTNTQNQPAPGLSLFGNNAAPAQNQQATNTTGGLFGGLASNTTQPAAPQNASTSLYQSRNFANSNFTTTHPQQAHLSSLLQAGLGSSTAFGALGAASQQDLARSRLRDAGLNSRANEKPIIEQIQTLIRKWDPQSADTLMQSYLYNAVQSALAPFYYRNADESEEEWERALENKPAPVVDEAGGQSVSFIPILVRGFRALGDRVEYQAKTVHDMRARLHEMNNSLDAVMATHSQKLTVRLENASRQHVALSHRCLRLAVKTQVLRQKGYALSEAEEVLRKRLFQLQQGALDPELAAREEEVWARMVALRERSRWLEEEGKRLGGVVEQQGDASGLSEEVLARTKRILKEYDAQIAHLAKELESVATEFQEVQ